MTAPRFTVTSLFAMVFADRLRLEAFDDQGRLFVAASANGDAHQQAPIVFDLPKQDAAAYRRAVEAFNQVLDQHEGLIARRNERRRARRVTIAERRAA